MRIPDLVPAYIAALLEETTAAAKVKTLRAHLDTLVRAENAATGSDRWKAPGYGASNVRLDGTDKGPTVTIGKDAEFADWLAQRDPSLVTATITVPANRLGEALTALEFADVTVTESAVRSTAAASKWVEENVRAYPDVYATDPSWVVQQIAEDDEGRAIVVEPSVPGLVAIKKAPRLVVTLDKAIRSRLELDAVESAEATLAALTGADPEPEAPAGAEVGVLDAEEAHAAADDVATPAASVALKRRRKAASVAVVDPDEDGAA